MSPRVNLDENVFDAALTRLEQVYSEGHRCVVSFSAGKDSTCCLELALIAATATKRLPVEVVLRDEEVMFPGTYEYAERVQERDDVELHWLVAHQPILNAFNREQPYWWVFDAEVPRDQWVRQPPPFAEYIDNLNIEAMTTHARFPPPSGKGLVSIIGLRTQESRGRLFGLHSSGGFMTKPHKVTGVRGCRPIYDWLDGDVWKAIDGFGWDYNKAYDTMHRMGMPRTFMRIMPPTMNSGAIQQLSIANKAWPAWFDKVCTRLPGIRTAAQFGSRAITPERRSGESWEATYRRECIERAPAWIAERATLVMTRYLKQHAGHATTPLPEVEPCPQCQGGALGSWRAMTRNMYNGEPFATKYRFLPYMEPEFFRPGAGTWDGTPAW